MSRARRNPAKAALIAFPVFYLGSLALTLHGGPCTSDCHLAFFWPTCFGGPLVVGLLSAALPRFSLPRLAHPAPREDAGVLELDA